jgi:hypothetical protein
MWAVDVDPDWDDDEDTLPGKSKEDLRKKFKLPDGSLAMECVKCHHYYPWAEPNQPDETFKCYECRMVW